MNTQTFADFGTLCLEDMGMAGLSRAETDAVLASFMHLRNKSPSILIIDDDIELSWLMETGLRRALPNAEIVIANDPYEGLNQLVEKDFGLVVLDWNLQGINGMEILRRADHELQLDPDFSDIRYDHRAKVVVVSVDSKQKCKIDGLEYFKPVGHIHKMQKLDSLIAAIHEHYTAD